MTGSLSRLRGQGQGGGNARFFQSEIFRMQSPPDSPTLTLPRKREREPVIISLHATFSNCLSRNPIARRSRRAKPKVAHPSALRARFKASRRGHSFATMPIVSSYQSKTTAPDHSKIYDVFHRKLINLPRLSPSHEPPATSIFRSRIIRFGYGLWSRRLSSGGRYFLLASGLFFGYGATSLEFQAFVPLAYALVVWILAGIALIFERPAVTLRFHQPPRVAAGETVRVELEIEGRGGAWSAESAVLPHRLPAEIGAEPEIGTPIRALEKGEIARVSLDLRPEKRGVFALGGYRVQTDAPFGLLHAWRVFESHHNLVVYPTFTPLERLELPMGRRYQPGGVASAASRGESVEYIGNRDYREGDAVRDIDWRATARLCKPVVREYREEYFLRAAIVLDTHVPEVSPQRCADFERAVSLGAACGDWLNRADMLVDILAAGPKLHHLQAGRGLVSLDQMLDILAGVDSGETAPWQGLEAELSENLESVTSVVCIFLDWDEARRAFALKLLEAGAAVKCVVVREGKTTLETSGEGALQIVVIGDAEWATGVRQL